MAEDYNSVMEEYRKVIEFVHIEQAARILGVSKDTLRRWERKGLIIPDNRTMGGWRLYRKDVLERLRDNGMSRIRE